MKRLKSFSWAVSYLLMNEKKKIFMLGAMQLCRVKSNVSETSSVQYFTDSSYSKLYGSKLFRHSLLSLFTVMQIFSKISIFINYIYCHLNVVSGTKIAWQNEKHRKKKKEGKKESL